MDKEKVFEIVITTPALRRYQETVLAYLFEHFSVERAAEIDLAITQKVAVLSKNPFLGTREKYLDNLNHDFRFLLHKESRNFEIKIIYFVSLERESIFVTDFFPTLMNPTQMMTP